MRLLDPQSIRKFVDEFIKKQDEARLLFAWRLASATGKTELTFEEFHSKARPEDFEAAQDWVMRGNARWAGRYEHAARPKTMRSHPN